MSRVIPQDQVGKEIVLTLFRDGLRTAAASGTDPLEDPRATERANETAAAFVLTSFPDRAAYWPHIIAEEADDDAQRPDHRVDLFEHDGYLLNLRCIGRSKTEAFNLRAQVKDWIARNIQTFRENGFHDVSFGNGAPVAFEDTDRTYTLIVTCTGTLYTHPSQ